MTSFSHNITYLPVRGRRRVLLQLRERPSALVALTIAFLFLLPVALIPSERGQFLSLPGLPALWWSTALLYLFAASVVAFRWVFYSHPIHRATRRYLLIPIFLLGAWQACSLLWNGRSWDARAYSLVEITGMVAAVSAAAGCVSGLGGQARWNTGKGLTLFVAAVALLYAGLSFLFPSLRPSSAWMDRTTASLGFVRVFGPLGVATTLNFVLVPAMGFALGSFLSGGWSRFFWGCLAITLALTVVATGSRGGLISLAAFAGILVLASRARAAFAIIPIGAILGVVVLAFGIPERFRDFRDEGRMMTYRTAMRAFTANPANIVLGTGHGALYSKLEVDATRRLRGKSRWYLAVEQTPYGNTLRSSHSTMLRTLAEAGPLGLGLLLIPLTWVFHRSVSSRYHRPHEAGNLAARCALAGCAAVIPYMGLEDFFLAFWPLVIWSMFVVIAAEMLDTTAGNRLGGFARTGGGRAHRGAGANDYSGSFR